MRKLYSYSLWRILGNSIGFLMLLSTLLVLAYFVGNRDIDVGTDTYRYITYFNEAEYRFDYYRYEPVFHYLALIFRKAQIPFEYYFAFLFFLFNVSYLLFYLKATSQASRIEFEIGNIFLVFGFLFLSSWYISATTNGLRQGLALPFLYLSILHFSEFRVILSTFYMALACGFHLSSVLLLPFYFLVFLKARFLLISAYVASAFYYLGISEAFVRTMSGVLGVTLYTDISESGSDAALWVGFQLNFVFYTLFWASVLYHFRRHVEDRYKGSYIRIWKFYCVSMMPYFFFGFGAFSNRYAFIGWLLLPAVQACFVLRSNLNGYVKLCITIMIFVVGLVYYSLYLNGISRF